jgi:hypothetical protein
MDELLEAIATVKGIQSSDFAVKHRAHLTLDRIAMRFRDRVLRKAMLHENIADFLDQRTRRLRNTQEFEAELIAFANR